MKRIIFPLALICLLLAGCDRGADSPPPDLLGYWSQQQEDATFYQVAVITEDSIECYWFLPEAEELHLYWSGSFTPPTNGKLPYKWVSENNPERTKTSPWAMRDEVMTFQIDKKGNLTYSEKMANLRVGVTLYKEEEAEFLKPGILVE